MDNVEINIGNPEALQKTVESYLLNFGKDVSGALGETLDELGKEAVKKLQNTSPKNTGDYKKGWRYKRKVKGKNGFEAKVYNATRGQLTHLLEKEHPIVRNGEVVGRSKAHVHIAPVNEWVQSELPRRFAQKIQK